jgi:hypothetical protein
MTDRAEPENAQGPDAKAAAQVARVFISYPRMMRLGLGGEGSTIREDLRGPFDLSDRF